MTSALASSQCPCILVASSSGADTAAAKCNCSFAGLPGRFGVDVVEGIDIAVDTVHDAPTHVLNSLRLRFIGATELRQPETQDADMSTAAVVSTAGEDPTTSDQCPKVQCKADAHLWQQQQHPQSPHSAPWIDEYRRVFQHSIRCSEHEFFDQPVLHVVALSSVEVDHTSLVDAFRGLQRQTVPQLMAQRTFSSDVPVFYVLVHDNSEPAPAPSELIEMEKAMHANFGHEWCRLLRINSGNAEAGWFASEDVTLLRAFMLDFASHAVVPCMQQKVRDLHAKISELRKGFKNQWKSWFGGKRPDAEREGVTLQAGAAPRYSCDALESQIRWFADLAFMLQDFDLALTHYRIVSADYKADRAWKYHAGTLEMIGMCLYCLNGSRREIETNLEQAIVTYQRERCTVYATRATFLLFDFYHSWRRNLDASRILMRASDHETDNDCRAAIMLELAGFCFLQMTPSQPRKYAFYLVLAGFRYNLAQQRRHTVRCYSTALHMYCNNGWVYVEDHLNFALGRQSKALKQFPESMQHLMMLLRDCKQPAERQEFFLKEFVQVATKLLSDAAAAGENFPPVSMPVPRIDDATIQVKISTESIVCQPAPGGQSSVEEDVWNDMKSRLLDVYRIVRIADGCPQSAGRGFKGQCCYVGEEIVIEVALRNPLQTQLMLTDLSLVCELCRDKEVGAVASDEAFDVESRTVVLPALSSGEYRESATGKMSDGPLQLRILPKVQGEMKLAALRWRLLGELPCTHVFKITGARMNKTPAQRKSEIAVYKADNRLNLRVCPPMPLLEVSISEQPCSLLAGEVRRLKMKLTNIGRTADMESVTMCISDPEFCFVSDGVNDISRTVPGPQCRQTTPSEHDVAQDFSLVTLIAGAAPPPHGRLAAGCSAEFAVWFHGCSPGRHTISFLFYYDCSAQHLTTECRMRRYSITLNVQPALRVEKVGNRDINASALMGVSIANDGKLPMALNYLCCVSNCHQLAPHSSGLASELAPSQHVACQLQLSPAVSSSHHRAITHSCHCLRGASESVETRYSTDVGPVWQFILRQSLKTANGWIRSWVIDGEQEQSMSTLHLGVLWTVGDGSTARFGYSSMTLSRPVASLQRPRNISALGLTQRWQGRRLFIGSGPESELRESILNEQQLAHQSKVERKAAEMALMAAKNAKRRERSDHPSSLHQIQPVETPSSLCPVLLDVHTVPPQQHDFLAHPFCEVTIKLTIRNISRVFPTTVCVNVADEQCCGFAGWSGLTSEKLHLHPQDCVQLSLGAAFTQVGVFEFGSVTVEASWASFRCTMQSSPQVVITNLSRDGI